MPIAIPTVDELNALAGRVNELTARVAKLEGVVPTPPTPPIPPTPPLPTVPMTERRAKMLVWMTDMVGKNLISGQYHSPPGQTDVDNRLWELSGGEYPAMTGESYWEVWDQSAMPRPNVSAVNNRCIQHWGGGGLVCITGFLPNPRGQGGSQNVGVNIQACLTQGTIEYFNLHRLYDQEIAGLKALQDAGVIVLYRPFLEAAGGWFWWGVPNIGAGNFNTLWRQRYDYYKAAGLQNLIWVLSQYAAEAWPGDDVVDIHGEDIYANDPAAYKSRYDAQIAAHPSKIWAAAEWGPGTASQGGSVDLNWVVEQFRTQMPKSLYVMAWSGGVNPPGWALCQQQNLRVGMANPYFLTLKRLGRPV